MDNGKNMDFLDEEMEMSVDIITLTDEEGAEHTFELVDSLEKDGENYVALITASGDADEVLEDDGNLVIMKIIEEGGEEILEIIEDDEEFETISEIFMERLSDLYEFEEEDDEDE